MWGPRGDKKNWAWIIAQITLRFGKKNIRVKREERRWEPNIAYKRIAQIGTWRDPKEIERIYWRERA